jgi:hypothetical protein
MGFGFDDIDKKFRPKEPIKLECVGCGTTEGIRMTELYGEKQELCPDCRPMWVDA